jgi:hypothetical protein
MPPADEKLVPRMDASRRAKKRGLLWVGWWGIISVRIQMPSSTIVVLLAYHEKRL